MDRLLEEALPLAILFSVGVVAVLHARAVQAGYLAFFDALPPWAQALDGGREWVESPRWRQMVRATGIVFAAGAVAIAVWKLA